MSLAAYIRQQQQSKPLLVMAHVVCGYPSFEVNWQALEVMAAAGVDIVELQFPFSEPSADGPLFVKANQVSLANGTTVAQCFEFMKKVTDHFPFKVLMMGYYNTAFKMGYQQFVDRLAAAGGCGYILPDLPLEEAEELHSMSALKGIEPIILMAPTNTDARLQTLANAAKGFVYSVARKGVTGTKTEMDDTVGEFINRCKQFTDLPVGVGFGISGKADMDYLKDKADIAIIGTAALKAWEEGGRIALEQFFHQLMA